MNATFIELIPMGLLSTSLGLVMAVKLYNVVEIHFSMCKCTFVSLFTPLLYITQIKEE